MRHVSTDALAGVAATFALATAFGATQTWVSGWRWSERGFESYAGMLTLGASLAAALISAARITVHQNKRAYLSIDLLPAVGSFVAALWFYRTHAGAVDATTSYIEFFVAPRQWAGFGLHLSLAGGAGQVLAVALNLFDWRPQPRLPSTRRVHWPIRRPLSAPGS